MGFEVCRAEKGSISPLQMLLNMYFKCFVEDKITDNFDYKKYS